ncbi:MAG: 1,2-phenylacetyl-CoA epoxidase subunit PaaD [Woeseiaceae bacterium]|nr:1,2-phenylacetyl-CoA epoxidase subunit PaaD [Woeseiaceae bacterium]
MSADSTMPVVPSGNDEMAVRRLLANVADPEIPVLTVLDLGVVRAVVIDGGRVTVDVAPTYSGCPAMEMIEAGIAAELNRNGYEDVRVRRVLSPPWTTDWISDAGRDKLKRYGIAPPAGAGRAGMKGNTRPLACPRCDSVDTERLSEFGSTACKAAYRCRACLEPFEYFKCI